MDPYDVLFSSIQRDSGLLTYQRTSQNIKALEAAFNELVTGSVLLSWERTDERRKGRKIIDIKYRLLAHTDFIREVKAANARMKESRSTFLTASGDKFLSSGR